MKRQLHLLAVMFVFAAFPFIKVFSNNLSVSNVTYSTANSTVTFDLKWDNSWSNSTSGNHNWDAAWVFVKFKLCTDASNIFTHGLVSTTLADHDFNVLAGATTYAPTKTDGTSGIDNSPNNTGVMLRNAADPVSGTNNARVTLKMNNMPVSGALDMRVYGIETVFIPGAPFLAGDGYADSSTVGSSLCFSLKTTSTSYLYTWPILIADTTSYVFISSTSSTYCPSGVCVLQPNFQKGSKPFYLMKYEISQGQYKDFLNATSSIVQSSRWQGGNTSRYTITFTGNSPDPFTTTRPDRACNYLSWYDFSAYLDWAAMRPLSELEFEKAARGTAGPVPYEMAWGNPYNGVAVAAGGISGTENGTETVTTAGANIVGQSIAYTSGDGGSIGGPLRCGIFATAATTNRNQSGAGFYGAMELSGNIYEYYVSVRSGLSGNVSASGIGLGDGNLNLTGNADVATWPTFADLNSFPANIIRRGGGWQSSISYSSGNPCTISYRSGGSTLTRQTDSGGRGGR